jgi:hypothetical protein
MAIYERNETYVHRITIRDNAGTKTNPSTVSDNIFDPCNNQLVTDDAMTNESTGVYRYYYPITSTATYGKYRTLVDARDGSGNKTLITGHYYVMPWKVQDDVRAKMGITKKTDVDDDAMSNICWTSYKKALRDAYQHHYNETPCRNPDTGAGFDGTNTTFQTKNYPIADVNGDGSVTGNNDCGNDITGYWIDNAGHRNECSINVTTAANGEITITQDDGVTAIPSNNEGVKIDYWSEYDSFDDFLLQEAVAYLAAHFISLRITEEDKVTMADVNKPVVLINPKRFKYEYKRLMRLISKPKIKGED